MDQPSASLPMNDLPPKALGGGLDLLAGIRVLDLTTSIAGPYAGMLLGDLGAEVLKVERPGRGDDCRAWGPPFLDGESLWFLSVNRNKHSITLDYSGEAGRAVLHDLARRCDVVLVNLVSRVQRKLGIDPPALAALRPDLVHVSLTGFGLQGPRADMPCYDLIAEGYSSVMDLTGEAQNDPQKVGTPAADLIAGMDAAMITLAALLDRARTGRGHALDVAMVDSMTRFMSPRIVPYLGSGIVPRRTGAKDSVIAVYQVFHAADAPMNLALGNDAIWKRFWSAVGEPGVGEDPKYASNAQRHAARAEIVARIAAVLKLKPRDHWLPLLAAANVPAGPIYRADEVAADAALKERGVFYRLEADGRAIPQVGLGIHVDGAQAGIRMAPPRLGEHTENVLSSLLGYDNERIAKLRAGNVI
ncbi:MAG: CoA transferase [Betaproteobacteria bacterium]|nr:MAG: CoA transferase [Betaproteobacteria bacterium]